MALVLKSANKRDLEAIAVCHRSAFPSALSSALGHKYVVKMLNWYLHSSKAFLFWLEEDGQCAGYCGGMIIDGTLKHGSASSMAQYTFNIGVSSLLKRPWLTFHPEMLRKFKLVLKNLLMRFKIISLPTRFPGSATQSSCGLVVIAVAPDFQKMGFGRALLEEFENRSLQLGVNLMTLSVKSDNLQAIRVYEKNGWTIKERRGNATSMWKAI